jgi:hypothetical protein
MRSALIEGVVSYVRMVRHSLLLLDVGKQDRAEIEWCCAYVQL